MRRNVGIAIGQGISPVVEGLDIDAIVHQIDLQDLLEQVDLDHLLNRIDVNRLLDRVDLNRQLDRIDMDKLLEKVDVNALIQRSNLEMIIERSSSGFISKCLHFLRARLALFDQSIQRIGRLACFSKEPWLPPRPMKKSEMRKRRNSRWRNGVKVFSNNEIPWPKNKNEFGVAVQFRCCGSFIRSLARVIDNIVYGVFCAFFIWVIDKIYTWRSGEENLSIEIIWSIFVLFEFFADVILIGCTGRTIGFALLGVLVVSRDGRQVGFCQTIVRSLVSLVNLLLLGPLVGLVRRDGKGWNDLIACTAVVYAWDVSMGYRVESNNDFVVSIPDLDLSSQDGEDGVADQDHDDVENNPAASSDSFHDTVEEEKYR